MSKMKLEGVFPPITTPFDNDGHIEYHYLSKNIAKWNEIELSGYLVLGSNGEFVYLSEDEKLNIVKTARKSTPPSRKMLVGTGLESTRATIEFTKKVADLGADVAVVITPFYFKCNMIQEAFLKHFIMIADVSPIPIFLYNVPQFTGVNLEAKTVATLSSHESIVGIKDSSGNIEQLSDIIYQTRKEEFSVLTGSGIILYPSLCIGAVGGIIAISCVLPEICLDLIRLYKDGNHKEAKSLQVRLIEPIIAVTSKYGIPGLKAAMDLFGYNGGSSRLPLLPITKEETEDIKKIYTNAGFL